MARLMLLAAAIILVLAIGAAAMFGGISQSAAGNGGFTPTVVPSKPGSTPVPAPSKDATPEPAAPAPGPVGQCRDGELQGNLLSTLDRQPIGVGENWSISEVSWSGSGFAGFDRLVLVLAPLGSEFNVFAINARTANTRRFCGTGPEVTAWAVKAHVPSLAQASQDKQGRRPSLSEIPVIWVDFSGNGAAFNVVQAAPQGPSMATIQQHIEVTKFSAK